VSLGDVRFALRAYRRAPAFTAAALLSIGIGVGANTAIFSVTNALLFHPLPYPNADRLAILWNRSPGLNITEDWFSTAQYFDIKTRHSGLDDVAIAIGAYMTITGDGGEPDRIGAIRLSSNLLPMLGARVVRGRLLRPDDDRPGSAAVALLHYGTWTRRYGGDPAVVGRTVTLNGQPYEVVGVLAREFSLPREVLPTLGVVEDADLVLPLRLPPDAATIRTREDYNIVVRLKAGVTFAVAQTEMNGLTASLRREFPQLYPPNGGLTFSLVPIQEQVVGDVRPALILLSGAVGFVLLIACANVANLLLSRALGRRREMAARAALGASRARLVRQMLVESVLLALGGGVLGVLLAWTGVGWIRAIQPADVPRVASIAIDGDALAFTLAVSLVSGLLFGLVPALSVTGFDLHSSLKDAGRGASASGAAWARRPGPRQVLVVTELALSVVLLIGAGLLLRSFARVQQVPGGFDADGVLTFELALTGGKYPDSSTVRHAYRALWERLGGIPGVVSVGGVIPLPLSQFFAWGPIQVEGRTPPAGEQFINADQRVATSHYFETMGIRLVEGRFFTDQDLTSTARVVIVDDRMAADLWPGQSAIGKRIRYGDQTTETPWETVVGVVARVKQYALDADARIAFYRPHTQQPSRSLYVTVRTAGDPRTLAGAVRAAVRAVDPDLPVFRLTTMRARVETSLARRRFLMTLLALFAVVAAALAAIGVYGVMAYLVSQGAREMGIRIALGASPAAIQGLVLRQGLVLGVVGVAAGVAGALGLTRLVAGLLFGIAANDPLTFTVIATTLAAVVLAASYLPARRAARTDPVVALRSE
jgi:putative ABC transport system permease protein